MRRAGHLFLFSRRRHTGWGGRYTGFARAQYFFMATDTLFNIIEHNAICLADARVEIGMHREEARRRRSVAAPASVSCATRSLLFSLPLEGLTRRRTMYLSRGSIPGHCILPFSRVCFTSRPAYGLAYAIFRLTHSQRRAESNAGGMHVAYQCA